jgi:hypothetical protein
MTTNVTNIPGDLRVPHIAADTNGHPVDCEQVIVNGVTYYRQRVTSVISNSFGSEISQINAAFGEQVVVQLHPQWQQSFEYTVDNTELNYKSVSGSGAVTQANAMAVCSTGTTTSSIASLESRHHAKYKAGFGMLLRFSAMFTTPVANTYQYAGMVDDAGSTAVFKNGFAIGYNGTSLVISRFANDTQYDIPRAQWTDPLDGTGASGMTINPQKLNVFYIQAQYLGAGAIKFWAEDSATGVPFVFHTIPYANLYTTPSTYNPNYHMRLYVNNRATTSNLTISCASYGYFIEGITELVELQQPQFSSSTITKNSITTATAIFTIRNKSLYNSKTNYLDIMLERCSCSIEASAASNLGTVRLVKNATLGGTPSYTSINLANSIVEMDTAGTTVTGGETILSFELAGKNDKDKENLISYKIVIHPGETLTYVGESSNSATIKAATLWKELI